MIGFRCAVVLAAAALALTGCAPATGDAGPTSPSISTPSPIASPTAGKPALADLILTPDALGDIRLDKPVPPTTAIADYNPVECVSTERGIKVGDADAGAWAANYPDEQNDNAPSTPFAVITDKQRRDGAVTTIWVWSAGIHTASGIQVGSTRTQLTGDYTHFDATLHGPLSDVYVVNGKVGFLEIEVARSDANDMGYWAPDQVDKVLWMGTIAPGGTAGAIAGTDVGPSPCPNREG
jgi:hypothetical protein